MNENQPKKKKRTLAANEEEDEKPDHQDFISALPDDLLHIILSKLRISDAAVTTAISKRWAPLFPTLPSLEIDWKFVPEFWLKDDVEWFYALLSVLDSRIVPIKKLVVAFPVIEEYEDYSNKAFAHVCAAGVEELSIIDTELTSYVIPPSVFACNTITKLEIDSCRLVVPPKLTGLWSVKLLVLETVKVADDDLRRMISQCTAMEKLVISDCHVVETIVVCAPSLSQLVIELYRPVGIELKSVPRLASVSVLFDDDELIDGRVLKTFEAAYFTSFLSGIRCVKDLRLDFDRSCLMSMILTKKGMAFPTSPSPECWLIELKKLCLHLPMNYHASNMIIALLLNSSPHLTEVIICDDTMFFDHNYCSKALESNFWKEQLPAECVKHHLTTATFYLDENLSEYCFVFPKFLLLTAANLKNMNLLFYYRKPETISKTEEKIRGGILGTQIMASLDVEIMIKPTNQLDIPCFK